MTERDYFEHIRTIRKQIAKDRLERANDLLTRLYAYKPVRLLWFVAKAEYILKKEENPEAALAILDGKYFLGEDYPGLRECMEFRVKALRQAGKEHDAIREEYCYQKACGKDSDLDAVLIQTLEAAAENPENEKILSDLENAFYHTSDTASSLIVQMEQIRSGFLPEKEKHPQFSKIANYGYLEEKIAATETNTFILVMDEYLAPSLEILGNLLSRFGHQVFLLTEPLPFETENCLDLQNTLEISMDNMQCYPDLCIVPPVVLTQNGVPYGDNREYMIDYICREKSLKDNVVVLCSGCLLDDLYRRDTLRGRMDRLSPYETDFQEEKLHFAWVGNYLSYISDLYGYDVRKDIDVKPEVAFSILIPARNSAETLRYSLQTCLNQRYTGSYEIVVSDNSVDGNTDIYDLCQELNDPRIRYVKTPRSLILTKSFEFGYLQTRGEFVLSMGSDDGLLPWGLNTLEKVLKQFPEEEIVLWDRGFYAWPGFNGGQENMFTIPRMYDKENITVGYTRTSDFLDCASQNEKMIYSMPLLYINSGFRRTYLKTLLKKTGKLWDGSCQDIHTGIINCCIQERILQVVYPITIAGMSSTSIGYLVGVAKTKLEQKRAETAYRLLYHQENVGKFVPPERNRLLMPAGSDACVLYFALSCAVAEGVLTEERADQVLNWQNAVLRTLQTVPLSKENSDSLIHGERFMAGKIDGDRKQWFEQEIYSNILIPHFVDDQTVERQKAQKMYQEERNSAGGETLDASRYGVENIMDAVSLFEKRSGL